MDAKHVVNLQGKDYPLWVGILAEAHERGLQGIETQLIQIPTEENGQTAIVKATARMKDGSSFDGHGDANPKNVGSKIVNAILRMAETRAKGRALRDACNIGQTMLEELGDLDEARSEPAAQRGNRRDSSPSRYGREADEAVAEAAERGRERMASGLQTGAPTVCSEPGCGTVLNQAVVTFSMKHFGKPYCREHQPKRAAA